MTTRDLVPSETPVAPFLPLLARIPMLEALDQNELAALAEHLKVLEVPKGTVIVREGDTGDETFFLAAGDVEIFERMTLKTSRIGFEDKERTLVRLSADVGVFIGELALFENVQRSANVVALSPCVLLMLTRGEFDFYAQTWPAAALKILRSVGAVLAGRVLKMSGDIKKLTTALSIAVR
jgi:CRP-like cAMP-binding protein